MEISDETNQPKDNPINIWEEFKAIEAADETQPFPNRTGDETTETEPLRISNQVSDEAVTWSTYWPLCQMIQMNDWKGVQDFVGKHPKARTDAITYEQMTIFHYLIENICYDKDNPVSLIENLASEVQPMTSLEQKDNLGFTALTRCSYMGNTRVSEILVKYNPQLPNIVNSVGLLPIHDAAAYGHKDLVQYLIQVTAEDKLRGSSGAKLISRLIESKLYGVARDFLKQYPWLGRDSIRSRSMILATLAEKPMAFKSGSRLGCFERFIYNVIPVKKDPIRTVKNQSVEMKGDVENPTETSKNDSTTKLFSFESLQQMITSTKFGSICQELNRMFWKVLMLLFPCIKVVHEQKVTHMQTTTILRMICEGIPWNDDEVLKAITPLLEAARFGISELVNRIVGDNDQSIYWTDDEGLTSNPSSEIAGAALQMQRELQWFKVVEDFVPPSHREEQNSDKKTPREVFTASHKELVKEGEKWMKETAESCTIAVALIITVVFAAAFTVPGGNNDKGAPNFLNDRTFLIFVISDALALFSSIASLLMFLGILTSRYAEEDFLMSYQQS